MKSFADMGKEWIYLRLKHRSSLLYIRETLEKNDFPYCFLADLPDDYRGCCKRLKKDFLYDRLLVCTAAETTDNLVKINKEHLRYVGQYGKATSPVSMTDYRRLTLFFDKLDRDFIFEAGIPDKAKLFRLPGGTMAGVEGYLEYRGIGGYRLYFSILDLCTISIRVDKQELLTTEIKLMTDDLSIPRWYVLYSRRELECCNLLSRKGYQAYVPLRKKKNESGKEEKELILRGYVFLHIAPCRFPSLFKDIPGMSDRLLFDRSQDVHTPMVIPDKQFEDFVFLTENTSDEVVVTEETFGVGDTVRLCKTGFEGVEGKLVKMGIHFQVFVSLPHLRSGYLIKVGKGEFFKV